MKLPYTPLQHARAARRGGRASSPRTLDGMPVVCCSLHSQVAPVCAALGGAARRLRPARRRRAAGLALGHRAGAARARAARDDGRGRRLLRRRRRSASSSPRRSRGRGAGHDVAVCAIGPGIVGTGSRFGHGGLAAAEAANAARRARRRAGPRGARLGRRRARAPPRRLASHREARARRRRACGRAPWLVPAEVEPRAGGRRAQACRSRTWAAAPTRTRRSSRRPTPRAAARELVR